MLKSRTLIILTAIFLLSAAGDGKATPWRDDRPITVGHRGTTVLADENTMAAYQIAAEYGLDVIECDPKLTQDGVYVIMHDDAVDRTTNGHGRVADLTLAEIQELRTASGHEVPTLEQVLLFARDHDLSVYLDMKSPPADQGALLVKLLEDTGMTERVIAGCYHQKTCRMIEERNPKISTCVSWPWPVVTLGQAKRLGADTAGTLRGLASRGAVKRAHRQGLHMITMPINSKAELDKFKTRGLDALQSDDPRLLEPYGRNAGNSGASSQPE